MVINSLGQDIRTPWGTYTILKNDVDVCLNGPTTAQDMLYCAALEENNIPVRIPENEWLLHVSARSVSYSWEKFTYGRPLKRAWKMGEAGSFAAIKQFKADCSQPYEQDFLVQFAWPICGLLFGWEKTEGWGSFTLPETGQSYALLFQVKGGSIGQHGPEGFEALFRVCDEINVIPLMAGYRNYTTQDGHYFTSLVDLVEWANESLGEPTTWPAPLPDEWINMRDVKSYYQCLSTMRKFSLNKDIEQGLNLEELRDKWHNLL